MIRSIIFLFVAVLLASCSSPTGDVTTTFMSVNEGKVVKNEIEIPSVNYDQFAAEYLNRKDGKTYVVNFWATWCGPCVKELPLFEEVTATYSSDEVEVILVSIDMAKMKESHLVKFVKERDLKSTIVHLDDVNMNRWIPLIDEDWSGAIPVTLFYNGDRQLFVEDSFEEGELVKTLNEFIN